MNEMIYLGIIFLSSLIVALLQLPLGTLLLLYHASLGKKIPKKTRTLISSFISGSTLMFFLLLSASCFLIFALTVSGTFTNVSLVVLTSYLVVLGIFSWFFYYKRKNSTELWLPRKITKFINQRAKETHDNSESFSLGVLTVLSEIVFTAPLFLLSGNSILILEPGYQVIALVGFVLISVLPLIILRIAIRTGKNLADIQRWRLKNKSFFRVITGLSYLILATFILTFLLMGDKI